MPLILKRSKRYKEAAKFVPANAVALAEAGALPPATARTLLGGLLELHAIPVADFPWQAELGDAFNSRETELVRLIGSDAAGWPLPWL